MSAENPDFPPFSAMIKRALGDQLDPAADAFIDMLADDAVMEFPYAPESRPRSVTGRDALRTYLARVGDLLIFEEMSEPRVHRTTDPAVTILEYKARGRIRASDQPYEQSYISVVTIAGGRSAHFRDYWNPAALSLVSSSGDGSASG